MNEIALLKDVLDQSEIPSTSETRLDNLPGWDSLKMVRLMVGIEARLGRELAQEELEGLVCVGDVERLLNGQ